jgi:hypothetical protein
MRLSRERKLATLTRILDAFSRRFEVITVGQHAERADEIAELAQVKVRSDLIPRRGSIVRG